MLIGHLMQVANTMQRQAVQATTSIIPFLLTDSSLLFGMTALMPVLFEQPIVKERIPELFLRLTVIKLGYPVALSPDLLERAVEIEDIERQISIKRLLLKDGREAVADLLARVNRVRHDIGMCSQQ